MLCPKFVKNTGLGRLRGPLHLEARKKYLCDVVDVLAGQSRVVRKGDQAIRYRFRHRASALISETAALLDYITIDHGCVHELLPHGGSYSGALLAVSQQNWEQMIVVSCSWPLLRKNDVFRNC